MLEKLSPQDSSKDPLQMLKALSFEAVRDKINSFATLFDYLRLMGVGDYCQFDINIVRGLAYYTGPVYEIYDRQEPLRSVCGGGRYDNLLAGLGGQQVPATGFGMGDVVLELMLKERGLLGGEAQRTDFFVIDAAKGLFEKALEVASCLREQRFSAAVNYKRLALGKQLKQAANQNARWAVILGEETLRDGQVNIKNMADGSQKALGLKEFLARPGG